MQETLTPQTADFDTAVATGKQASQATDRRGGANLNRKPRHFDNSEDVSDGEPRAYWSWRGLWIEVLPKGDPQWIRCPFEFGAGSWRPSTDVADGNNVTICV